MAHQGLRNYHKVVRLADTALKLSVEAYWYFALLAIEVTQVFHCISFAVYFPDRAHLATQQLLLLPYLRIEGLVFQ